MIKANRNLPVAAWVMFWWNHYKKPLLRSGEILTDGLIVGKKKKHRFMRSRRTGRKKI